VFVFVNEYTRKDEDGWNVKKVHIMKMWVKKKVLLYFYII